MRALLETIQQEYGTTDVSEAMAIQNIMNGHSAAPKWVVGHKLLREDPSKWFRGTQIDERDLALINASPVPWINIGQQSFLKHVVCKIISNRNPECKSVARKLTADPAPQAQGPALQDCTHPSHPHPNLVSSCYSQ